MRKLYTLFLLMTSIIFSYGQNITVSNVGNLNTSRNGHESVVLDDGKVLVIGGDNYSSSISSTELYNPTTQSWTYRASMNTARTDFACVTLHDGRIMVMGGYEQNGGNYYNTCEIYDPNTNSWTNISSMNKLRYDHEAIVLDNGDVLVCGGTSIEGSAEIYHPYNDTWETVGDMHEIRAHFTLTKLDGGDIIAVGGSSSYNASKSAEVFNFESKTWTYGSLSLDFPFRYHSTTLLEDGNLLVYNDITFDQCITYNPITLETITSETITIDEANSYAKGVLLSDGKVLTTSLGDIFTPSDTKYLRIYDPQTNTWSYPTSNLLGTQEYTTNVLQDGTILLAGGSFGGNTVNSCRVLNVSESPSCNINTTIPVSLTNSSICYGQSSTVQLQNTENGVDYELYINETSVSTIIAGNGATISIPVNTENIAIGDNFIKVIASKFGCNTLVLENQVILNTTIQNSTQPILSYTGDSINCFGAEVIVTSTSDVLWNGTVFNDSLTFNELAYYTAQTIDVNGCYSEPTVLEETAYYPEILSINVGSDIDICFNDTTQLTVNILDTVNGVWRGIDLIDSLSGQILPQSLEYGTIYEYSYELCGWADTMDVVLNGDTIFDYSFYIQSTDDYSCNGEAKNIIVSSSDYVYAQLYVEDSFVEFQNLSNANLSYNTGNLNADLEVILQIYNDCFIIWDTLIVEYIEYEDYSSSNTLPFEPIPFCKGDTPTVLLLDSDTTNLYFLRSQNGGNVSTVSQYYQGTGDSILLSFDEPVNWATSADNVYIASYDVNQFCDITYLYPGNFEIPMVDLDVGASLSSSGIDAFFTTNDTLDFSAQYDEDVDYYEWWIDTTLAYTGDTAEIPLTDFGGTHEMMVYGYSNIGGCKDSLLYPHPLYIYDMEESVLPFDENICHIDELGYYYDYVTSYTVMDNGNRIIGGVKFHYGSNYCSYSGSYLATLTMLDSTGNLLWQYDHEQDMTWGQLGDACGSWITAIEVDENNDIYISGNVGGFDPVTFFGESTSTDASSQDWGYLGKFDEDGNKIWLHFMTEQVNSSIGGAVGITDVLNYSETELAIAVRDPSTSYNLEYANLAIALIDKNTGLPNRSWNDTRNSYVYINGGVRLNSSSTVASRAFSDGLELIKLDCGKIGIYGMYEGSYSSFYTGIQFDDVVYDELNSEMGFHFLAIADPQNPNDEWDDVLQFSSYSNNNIGYVSNGQLRIEEQNGYYYTLSSHGSSRYIYDEDELNVDIVMSSSQNVSIENHPPLTIINKYDSQGNHIWYKKMTLSNTAGFEVVGDEIFILGHNVKFVGVENNGTYIGDDSDGFSDLFMTKLDTNGNVLFVEQFGGNDVFSSTNINYNFPEELMQEVYFDECNEKFYILGKMNDGADVFGNQFNPSSQESVPFMLDIALEDCSTPIVCDVPTIELPSISGFPENQTIYYCEADDTSFIDLGSLEDVDVTYYYDDGTGEQEFSALSPFDYDIVDGDLSIWGRTGEFTVILKVEDNAGCNFSNEFSCIYTDDVVIAPSVITGFPNGQELQYCSNDTLYFDLNYIGNYSFEYSYNIGQSDLPISSSTIFDFTQNDDELKIWNVEENFDLQLYIENLDSCGYLDYSCSISIAISDTIYNSIGSPLYNSKVYALEINPLDSMISKVDSTYTDNNGAFVFNHQNFSYLKVLPNKTALIPFEIPTYFVNSAVIDDAVNPNCISVSNTQFTSLAGDSETGDGMIGGLIGDGSGKNNEIGNPISGEYVLLVNNQYEPITYTYTDNDGYFSFDDLPFGYYNLWIDRPYFDNPIFTTLYIDAASPVKDSLLFVMHKTWLEIVNEEVSIDDVFLSNIQIFPNPTKGKVIIDFKNELSSIKKSIEIYNSIGQLVYSQSNNMDNTIEINMDDYVDSNGVYLLKVYIDDDYITRKIIKK